jgi:hypothetical protein
MPLSPSASSFLRQEIGMDSLRLFPRVRDDPFDLAGTVLTTDELAAAYSGIRQSRMRKSGRCPLFLLLSRKLRRSAGNGGADAYSICHCRPFAARPVRHFTESPRSHPLF